MNFSWPVKAYKVALGRNNDVGNDVGGHIQGQNRGTMIVRVYTILGSREGCGRSGGKIRGFVNGVN